MTVGLSFYIVSFRLTQFFLFYTALDKFRTERKLYCLTAAGVTKASHGLKDSFEIKAKLNTGAVIFFFLSDV